MKTRTTKHIISGKNVLEQIPEILKNLWPDGKAVIFADENTWQAAGSRVAEIIRTSGYSSCPAHIFPATPRLHADTVRIAESGAILSAFPGAIPVVVGSGTLNDIVKRAAEEHCRGYICVPTAPSVDGYTSFGAAITVDGFKTTLPCAAPTAIVADESVMAAAPYELLAAGYGDLAAKIASGRDWLIARELGFESIDPAVWDLSQGRLLERLSDPERLAGSEPSSVKAIFDGLCDTGLAMQDQGDSRPASGAEHHISHCWEMRGLAVNGVDVLHGEKVASGTVLSTAFSEILFSYRIGEIRQFAAAAGDISVVEREREVRALYAGTGIRASAIDDIVRVSLEKLESFGGRKERLARITASWDAMKRFSFQNRPRYAELVRMFVAARCPSFQELGIEKDLVSWGILAAQTIRNRYTVLDLAWDLGMLVSVKDLVITKINM